MTHREHARRARDTTRRRCSRPFGQTDSALRGKAHGVFRRVACGAEKPRSYLINTPAHEDAPASRRRSGAYKPSWSGATRGGRIVGPGTDPVSSDTRLSPQSASNNETDTGDRTRPAAAKSARHAGPCASRSGVGTGSRKGGRRARLILVDAS
jgi:hypothetical protein